MEKVNEGLLHIINERFNMDLSACWEDIQDELLLGSRFGLQPSDLIYLFFDVEKEFGITIPTEDVVSGGFSSLRNITRMVRRALETNSVILKDTKAS